MLFFSQKLSFYLFLILFDQFICYNYFVLTKKLLTYSLNKEVSFVLDAALKKRIKII